ncbi:MULTISPECIES: type II toxin-antitoxin system PemK/MazF family toxin [unclassified Synechococcus]|uniref:type II toxin-antitoxin system PemK/MazF family toxin n=1 Tax=unclassified Synechococcus TaxID=2626047 RepID=UPI0021A25BE2|nr:MULTISPECIES: type II toxin-antitoxin system PemK/MazF family toxin [unclassified Synechococcus]MCT0212437.1 type II toxin-antitoxin system PemK/MazF family toxin [Synechococcus sp. CS-1326]MCT0234620.1 type II toxin-antitoxin system PemK/MazF family toxin [Synechococcus sp. CS-1327]
MKRGELWEIAGGPGFAGKPRPGMIVQDDAFASRDSGTVCLISSDPTQLPLFRVAVTPTPDKVLLRLQRSLLVFLGLAR